jgi:uncharacterized protein (UPF0276 family)
MLVPYIRQPRHRPPDRPAAPPAVVAGVVAGAAVEDVAVKMMRDRVGRRILDDHLHDPPDSVYDLLTDLAARCPNPLTVVLERDGEYPSIDQLLAQLARARRALESGRSHPSGTGIPACVLAGHRSAP